MRLIVVGCGKAKLDHSAKAHELYTGSLFRAAKRYACASGQPWVILSGAHGVISPMTIVRPYDAGPPEKGKALERWARKAALEVADRRERGHQHLVWPRVVLLAGERYAEPVARELAELGIEVDLPLARLGTGLRLAALKKMTGEAIMEFGEPGEPVRMW